MAGDLFFMQRYWGSEDENSIESGDDAVPENVSPDKNKDSENESFEPKRKKIEVDSSKDSGIAVENNCVQLNGEIVNRNHDKNINCSESPTVTTSKKKKKHPKIESLKNGRTSDLDTSLNRFSFPATTESLEENFRILGQVKGKSDKKIKPTLPEWLSNPTIIEIDLQGQKFPVSELSYLDDISKNNLKNAGINFLFPVQLTVIPWLMQSNNRRLSVRPSDLCVSAPTGSGKTLAFVLPIVQSLKSRVVCAVRALIVLPVSDLAIQVYKVFQMYIRGTDLKAIILTGQKSFTSEQNLLVKTGIRKSLSLVDIVVTTPGRLLDHINKTEGFCLQQLRYLVIDEADRMMDSIQKGWLKHVEERVYSGCNKSSCLCYALSGKRIAAVPSTACSLGYIDQPLQKLLYSATLSHDPEKLHTLSLYKPKLFTAQAASDEWIGKCPVPKDLIVQALICRNDTKPMVLCHFLKERQFKKVLCFTESVERAQRLHFILAEMDLIKVREISSNNRPVQRKIILEQFSSGKVNLLVCSDLVARGIDIEGVDCVISYDAPLFLKTYVHRMGRTARAGRKGIGVTLLTKEEKIRFKKMLESAEMEMPEIINIEDKDLEMYIDLFKNALTVADSKLKKLKTGNMQFNRKSKKFQKRTELQNTLVNSPEKTNT